MIATLKCDSVSHECPFSFHAIMIYAAVVVVLDDTPGQRRVLFLISCKFFFFLSIIPPYKEFAFNFHAEYLCLSLQHIISAVYYICILFSFLFSFFLSLMLYLSLHTLPLSLSQNRFTALLLFSPTDHRRCPQSNRNELNFGLKVDSLSLSISCVLVQESHNLLIFLSRAAFCAPLSHTFSRERCAKSLRAVASTLMRKKRGN